MKTNPLTCLWHLVTLARKKGVSKVVERAEHKIIMLLNMNLPKSSDSLSELALLIDSASILQSEDGVKYRKKVFAILKERLANQIQVTALEGLSPPVVGTKI